MAYLQHLKDLYEQRHMNNLKYLLDIECKCRLIKEVFDLDIQKIKKYIEDNFEEQIFFTSEDDATIQIDLSTVMLKTDTNEITKYFTDKTHYPLFEKHLQDKYGSYEIEMFIDNLTTFQTVKQQIKKELDGLDFDFNFGVSVRDKQLFSVEVQPTVYFSSEGFNRYDSEDD